MPAIRIENLWFSYGDHRVLREVSLSIREGEFFGIVGPNGSGKTTLLKILSGVLRNYSGEVSVFERSLKEISQRELARLVAVVPQESSLAFPFTVMEVVLMGRSVHLGAFSFERESDIEIARRSLRETDTIHLASRRLPELSGGEKQRVIVARALAQQPKILLLDEPTAFLDIRHEFDIYRLLRRLNTAEKLTVVVVCHNLNLASQYCSRLLMLKEGQVFRIGSPREILTASNIEAVYQAPVRVQEIPSYGFPFILPPPPEGED